MGHQIVETGQPELVAKERNVRDDVGLQVLQSRLLEHRACGIEGKPAEMGSIQNA